MGDGALRGRPQGGDAVRIDPDVRAPFAGLGAALLIICAERLAWVRPCESGMAAMLRRTGTTVSTLSVAVMATIWASWAGSVNEAPFAMWGMVVATLGLLLVLLKPTPLRAAIGIVVALIPLAFLWLLLSIASECARMGCGWAERFSVVRSPC